jgi:thiamine biosynthesis protein ThiS
MPKINTFLLNGQKYHINTKYEITLHDLIRYFNYNTSLLVLEYNNLICSEKDWENILITNEDKIELITIVGGG